MTFRDPVVDDVVLVRPAIQSPDYVPGVSGWSVNAAGDAEFNDAAVRGQLVTAAPDGSRVEITADPVAAVTLYPADLVPVAGPAGLRTGSDPVTSAAGLLVLGPAHTDGQPVLFLGRSALLGVYAAVRGVARLIVDAAAAVVVTAPAVSLTGDLTVSGGVSSAGRPVVTGPAGAACRMHWNTAIVTTDATGYAAITHGAGFTPAQVIVSQRASTGVSTIDLLTEAGSYTATTFRVRAMQAGAAYVGPVGVTYLCLA